MTLHGGARATYNKDGVPSGYGVSGGVYNDFSRHCTAGVRVDRDLSQTSNDVEPKHTTSLSFWGLFKF